MNQRPHLTNKYIAVIFRQRISRFFVSSRRRHTRWTGDWSSDVCSSDLPDAEILGLHLLALLIGYGEPAEVLVRPVRVPLWPRVVSVMVAAVVVNSWRRRSGGQGFPVVGGSWRLRWGLGRRDKGVSSGHSMQDDPKGIAHWVVGANSVWRGVLGKEGRDVEGKGLEGVRGRW